MKKYLISVGIILVIGFVFYQKVFIPKHTFLVITPKLGDVNISIKGIGEITSETIYKIGTLYGGEIHEFTLKEGQLVHKDDLIAVVDSVDLSNKIDELKSLISKLNNDKKSAIVAYKYQLEIFKKNSILYKKHNISSLEFEKLKTNKDLAKLKIDSLQSSISQTKHNIKGLEKKLSRYTIKSPISGYIIKKYISNYSIVTPNQPLVEIVDPSDVWVSAYIDTRISQEIKIGSRAQIKLRSSSKLYSGVVKNIKPINNNVTYEREVNIAFDKLPIPFYLNEQATVQIYTNRLKNTIQVPLKVVDIQKDKSGVWILKDTKALFVPTQVLAIFGQYVALKGINEDDKIIVPKVGNKQLKNGLKTYTKENQ